MLPSESYVLYVPENLLPILAHINSVIIAVNQNALGVVNNLVEDIIFVIKTNILCAVMRAI